MTIYYIVRYSMIGQPRIKASTYSLETAQELCSHPQTKGRDWFWGYTQHPPIKPSKAGYPSAGDLLKALPNNQ